MENNLTIAVKEYIENFKGITELSKEFRLPSIDIRNALTELGYNLGRGVSPMSVVNIKNAVDEYIGILNSNIQPNINLLAKKYNVSHSSISSNLKNKNIEIIKYPKVIQFNEHIFDEIDTEEKAYWLGFLHADGYITTRDNTVGLCLAEKDLNHIKKYSKFLGCGDNIKLKKSKTFLSYRCDIGNKYLKNVLVNNYNFTPNKSNDLTFPNPLIFKYEFLIRDYIRGYCDGDGSLFFGKVTSKITGKISNVPRVNILGTHSYLKELINYLISTNITKCDSKSGNLFSINYACKKAKGVVDYLYKDSNIYLDRKYEKYLDFCRHYKEL